MSDLPYDVFISYRRSDGSRTAQWIRRELQAFRAPRALQGKFSRKLRVYLDVAFEKGTIDFYEHTIRPALLGSRHLLVIATPDAALRDDVNRDWIKREIDEFSGGANASNLLLVRGAGAFDGPLPGDLSTRFENMEIVDLRDVSRFWFLNPLRASRIANEKLKLIAPIIGIDAGDMPILRREEERRAQSRIAVTLGALLAIFAAISTLTVFALNSRARATVALESSLASTGSLILSLGRMSGDRSEVRKDLNGLISDACDVFDRLRVEANAEPRARPLVVCYDQRARDHENLKELPQARALLEAALAQSGSIYQRSRQVDDARSVVTAWGQLQAFLTRHGSPEEQTALLVRAGSILDGLIAEEPYETSFVETRAIVEANIADATGAAKASPESIAALDRVADLAARTASKEIDRKRSGLLLWQSRLLVLAAQFSRATGKDPGDAAAPDRLSRAEAALDAAGAVDAVLKPDVRLDIAEGYLGLAGADEAAGQPADAKRVREKAGRQLGLLDIGKLSNSEKARSRQVADAIGRAGASQ